MDTLNVLFYLFAGISTLYIVHFGLYLIGANFYDIWQYKRFMRKSIPKSTEKRSAGISNITIGSFYTPEIEGLVTVAIPAHNEELAITRCLDSIRKSTYRKLEILVADDCSTDKTAEIVEKYIKRYPKMNLKIYTLNQQSGKGEALNVILRTHANGEFVMTLDADSVIQPDAITNAAQYFEDPKVVGVAANVQILSEPTILGTLQKFEHMISYRSKKTHSWLNCEFVVGGVASTYRMRILREVGFYDTDTVTEDIGLSIKITNRGNRDERLVYGSNVVAMTEGVMTFRALAKQRYRWKYGSLQNIIKYRHLIFNYQYLYTAALTFYRLPVAVLGEFILLLSPLAWTYAIYMTLTQFNPDLIIGSYLTITAYVLVVLWFDENLNFRSRSHLTLYAPIAYFIFYIMDLVQLIAVIRCALKAPDLINQKSTGSIWISPKRTGKGLAALK
jgi:cellulose synthase/poly-beta-1,6-N-acetylglucosamine synthase-like glycosyltransferase